MSEACQFEAQIVLISIKMPKFHYTDFHQKFLTRKVVDTNHESLKNKWWQIMKWWSFSESRRHKLSWHVNMFMTKSIALMGFSLLQCTRKVCDKVCGHKLQKSATQIMKVGDMICVADFHDLCPRQSPQLCHKDSVMEFGLNLLI